MFLIVSNIISHKVAKMHAKVRKFALIFTAYGIKLYLCTVQNTEITVLSYNGSAYLKYIRNHIKVLNVEQFIF